MVSAQVNKYNFLVVYEPYRALECLQGVGLQGKNCFSKMVSKLLRNWFWLYITWKNEQKMLIWHVGICLGHCTTKKERVRASLHPIKGAGFWRKMSVTKVFWRCSIQDIETNPATLRLIRHFFFFLVLGLILLQTAVLAKGNNCFV